eukprot:2992261-Amphidinium_carterae.1
MASNFDALGVTFDLSDPLRVTVKNKADRVTSLTAEIDEYLATKMCPHSSAESLRGRLLYADGQTFGKLG